MAAARAEAAIQRGKATEEYVDATEEMIEEEA